MKKSDNIFIVLFALVMSVSCSLADVKDYEGTESRVNISMDWSQVSGEHPDSMYVIASKLDEPKVMGYLYPEMTPLHDSVSSNSEIVWPTGNYAVLSFNSRDDIMVSNRNVLRKLSLSLPSLADAGLASILDTALTDYNPGIRYISDAGDMYADIQTVSVNAAQTDVVVKPEALTQNLTFTFYMNVEDDVEVLDVKAVLSGIVGTVYPMTGYVDYDTLCRMILPVEVVDFVDGMRKYEANSRILGLFPSETESLTTGKGILQLMISTASYQGDKVFYAGINLRNTISEAAPMEYHEEDKGYSIAKSEVVLEVPMVLEVSNDAVMGDANDGVDEWFLNEKIDIDL